MNQQMKTMFKTTLPAAAVPLLMALGATGTDPIAAEASAAASPDRPQAFAVCAGCHSTEPGHMRLGPSLAGVAGRNAGTLPGYTYSEALKASGLTWNAATLDKWLTSPQKTVPGTKMPFMGISDPARRKQVVDYLLTLK